MRRQHDAAGNLASQITAQIDRIGAHPTADDAFRITMLLAKLTGTLRIHFAQEDRHLYPSMMASGQGGAAATARRFFEEMGQIGPAIAAFGETWLNSSAIVRDWDGFRAETNALFAALTDRITRENEILYPLADALAEEDVPVQAA